MHNIVRVDLKLICGFLRSYCIEDCYKKGYFFFLQMPLRRLLQYFIYAEGRQIFFSESSMPTDDEFDVRQRRSH